MQADEWERIKQIFEAALALPEVQRTSYVGSACEGEPQLAAVVTELLEDHLGANRFQQTAPVRMHHVFGANELVASRFRIVRPIGDGGMGEVYEAFDERLRARVALKTLRHELLSDVQALERFRREILVAREVAHESVCKVFDLVEHVFADGVQVPCLTMQLIEGESLLKYLQRRRPLSPKEALPLILQIADAIDALHAHGIVHRDLKPSNIMLTERTGKMRAVVTDFGLAKPATHVETGLFETQADVRAGAPYFMAPELLREGRPSVASDIYALGLIIDEMVTDTRAFTAESLHSLYYQKLWESPVPPASRSAHLPPSWNRVILRCLSAEPADRYEHAGGVVAELESSYSNPVELPSPTSPVAAVPNAITESAERQMRPGLPMAAMRRRAGMVLGALLVVLAVAGVARSLSEPLKTSVVVFPIENLTNRSDLDYLCKGIGAEVMRRLTLIDGIQVIPYYEPRAKMQLNQLKGQLSLEGLLQVAGNRVRLTAQLSENRDGALLWSQNFERDMQNPLQLQSDIAEGSVQTLEMRSAFGRQLGIANAGLLPGPLGKLLGFQRLAVPRAATSNAAAFDHYLRGRYLFEERTVPAALDAIRSFENALREDPGFALAKAALADTQFVLMDFEYEPFETLIERARLYAEDAVRLNPELAEAHTSLAAVRQANWDFASAAESFKIAMRLNPKFARAHRWYSGLAMQFERYDESLQEMQVSIDLDPYDYPAQGNKGLFLVYARRCREAISVLEEALKHKDLIGTHGNLGDAYFFCGMETSGAERQSYFTRALQQADLAEAAVRRTMAQSPPPSGAQSIKYGDRMHAMYLTMSGQADAARPYLNRLQADAAAGRASAVPLAMYYGVVGDAEAALPLLEKAAEHKDLQLRFLRVSPHFDSLRTNPRFQALLSKIGLS